MVGSFWPNQKGIQSDIFVGRSRIFNAYIRRSLLVDALLCLREHPPSSLFSGRVQQYPRIGRRSVLN